MPPFAWLKQRQREPEVMDDPALDLECHRAALRGLSRLNGLSASVSIAWSPIAHLARQLKAPRLRILDIATGAGDIPLRLWHRGQRANLQLEIHGVDISPKAIAFARERAEASGAAITFDVLDVLNDELPRGFDVVMSSLFVHHLEDPQVVALLRSMSGAAGHLMLVSDLRRNLWGWMLAHSAARLLTTSAVVHTDAPLSVQGAYTMAELQALAMEAGLSGTTVRRRWPARQLLTWQRVSG